MAPRCPHCELRLPDGALSTTCRRVLRISCLATAAPYAHPIVRSAIDDLKYKGVRDLAKPLGALLAQALKPILEHHKPAEALLVPIPLHRRRVRERGFNQSALIAENVASELDLAWTETILSRTKNTPQQVNLPRKTRHENVRGAFAAQTRPELTKRTVILIDDVITTGATMREASSALKRAGAKNVWGAAVAYG